MDAYDATEIAYKNGFIAGRESASPLQVEINTRLKVAYEQLGKCHTKLCRSSADKEICEDFREVLNNILNIQVKLGMIKKEEDL